nr:MAG TPA: hypothetical protein [Caudoviricetes sp.]
MQYNRIIILTNFIATYVKIQANRNQGFSLLSICKIIYFHINLLLFLLLLKKRGISPSFKVFLSNS